MKLIFYFCVSDNKTYGSRHFLNLSYAIDVQWEDMMLSAPTFISQLRHLMILIRESEYNWSPKDPDARFQILEHPDSFHRTVMLLHKDTETLFDNVNVSFTYTYVCPVAIYFLNFLRQKKTCGT